MKKTFFASDFHLGISNSQEREKTIIRWLDQIAPEAREIFLVGDVFDFWFEYRQAIPKGYVRLLGRLAALSDSGIPMHFFTGNHDMWMFKYFEEELGIQTHRAPIIRTIDQKKIMIGHGDGLGPGDYGYKFLKKVFNSNWAQFLFNWIHPDLGIPLASFWSVQSRSSQSHPQSFFGPEKEWLIQYCLEVLQKENFDFFIFGHRHLPIDYTLNANGSRYLNLGEWIHNNSYAELYDGNVTLSFFENPNGKIFGNQL
jgi:UDP-2,3-diacylglucosamine hydrolase